MVTFMITVFAAVICGVTFSSSTASLNCTVMVLFATVWIGIWMPCATSASWLFCVGRRGCRAEVHRGGGVVARGVGTRIVCALRAADAAAERSVVRERERRRVAD